MKIKVSAHITAILFIATLVGLGDEVKGQQKAAFPEWAFCVAYQVRDADERDARPVNPKAGKDPFDDGDSRIPHGLIDDKNIVDVAALTTRVVKSGV